MLEVERPDIAMIHDSSDEEEEQEEEEEEPIDFAAEAAKTAARSLARSACQSYLKVLIPKCQEAKEDPKMQVKQLEALSDLVLKYPEMAAKTSQSAMAKGPEKISASGEKPMPATSTADPSPETGPALASPSNATGSPQSAQSVQPASPASPISPISPQKKAVRRGKEMKESIETPKTPQKTPKASPKRVVQKKKASGKVPTSPSQSNAQGQPEVEAPADLQQTWTSTDPLKTGSQATASPTVTRFGSTMKTTKAASPKAISASSSLTQLPSGTWRGPVETSGNDREMFLRCLSKHESMPLLTFRPRRGKDLWVFNASNPAPGTYPDLQESCTSKYLAPRQVSFGFSRKGSRWPANADQKPGPGAHSVVNFERFKYADPVRHSFGAAPRGRPNPIRQTGPGPGAYGIQRSADEEGPAVTMVGKFRKRGVLNYDEPGPGAYDPSTVLCVPTAPSVGFATALREDFYPKEDKGIPAPGTYDVMKQHPVGSDCLAFSIAGKRKRHDLTSHLYAGPGPGFYNHGSTFGYRSTWHTAGPAGHPAPPVPFAPPLAAPTTPKVAIAAA